MKWKIILPSMMLISSIFLLSNKSITSKLIPYDPLHPARGWNETFQNLVQNENYNIVVSDDYKLLSSLAYFMNEPTNLHLINDRKRRLTHYDLWNRMDKASKNILYVTYSDNEIFDGNLSCVPLRNVEIYSRKQLTLYNCTSK
tara:strand:- start:213 stop:641 length:429 start_codon:yes stop_codon:yes gene_type:complete